MMRVATLEDLESVAYAGQTLPSPSEMDFFSYRSDDITDFLSAALFWGHPVMKSCTETEPCCVVPRFARAHGVTTTNPFWSH